MQIKSLQLLKFKNMSKDNLKNVSPTDAKLPVISRFFEWFIPIGFTLFLIWALYSVFGW
jgi:hypothetical protein